MVHTFEQGDRGVAKRCAHLLGTYQPHTICIVEDCADGRVAPQTNLVEDDECCTHRVVEQWRAIVTCHTVEQLCCTLNGFVNEAQGAFAKTLLGLVVELAVSLS